ncbi:MAG: peptide-binding protein [Omnitrophica bacterium RIFCSPLOWO2_12_FULL_45_13]|nr:MAG: peptide-binding protein [Omnitrophica bacterium RIFCSPLOWO2_12_FULL_45_13]
MIKIKMRKNEKIPLVTLAVFFLIFAVNLNAAEEKKGEPSYGDAIVTASSSDARTLIPISASDSASSDICGMIFNGLVKYDKNVEIVGDLAEKWDIEDEGKTIIFHLRRDVRWHDSAPFTARDVEFTYKKLIDPNVKTPYSGDFERIKDFIILDDHTVKISYKEPFAPALSSWGMWIMPEHIFRKEDLNKTRFSRSPVGTGPYRFKSWRTGEGIELVSNHYYFEGRPYIDRYIYRIIPDDATTFLELRTQGVDMSLLTPLQFVRQTNDDFFKRRYNKFRYPSFGFTYMGYNLSDPKFQDAGVRQAINYAVNKGEIIDTVFFGLAKPTTGPFMLESWAYNKDVRGVSYDPSEAKRLLKEAGWADADGDGCVEKDGKIFEFTVLVNQGNAERIRCAELIQKYLKDVGIRMNIRVIEWSSMINEFINKRRFEAVLMGWFLSRDPDCYDIWHSSKTREGEFNFIGYKNDRVDKLLEEGRRTFDPTKRAAIYHKIHKLIYEDQPYLFLYSQDTLPIVNSRFRGVEASPIGIGYNFIKWYVPKSEQRYK